MNLKNSELKSIHYLLGAKNLLTLEDVTEVVETSIAIESTLGNKEVLLQKQVMTFSDPDRDYSAAVVILNNKVMVRTCHLALSALATQERIIYHVELWNKKESEFHHLAKNVNIKKIAELAISLC